MLTMNDGNLSTEFSRWSVHDRMNCGLDAENRGGSNRRADT